MKLHFSKWHRLIIAVTVLLLILIIIYAQFFLLSPLITELATKQQTLQNEQNQIAAASQKQTANSKTTSTENTRELQKKVPVKPLEDQFILDLEMAENISKSQIKTMGFSKDADVTTQNAQANAGNANAQQNTAANQQNSNQQTSANQNTTIQNGTGAQTAAATVSGMKKLTVNMSVESPNYEGLEKFIQTLESLQRIVVVESVSYSGGQEITSLDQQNQPLTFNITVSTFYMPGLAELESQLPQMDVPAVSGKVNPLSQFSDTTNSN